MSAKGTAYMAEDRAEDRAAGSLTYLLRFARGQWPRFLLGFGLLFAAAVLTVTSARILGSFVEEGLLDRDVSRAFVLGAWILGLEAGALVIGCAGRMVLASTSARSILEIRRSLFARLDELPLSYFDRQPLGRTVTRMTHDVESLES